MELKGVTRAVAEAIASRYPKLGELKRKYESMSKGDGELLLTDIIIPGKARRISKSISSKVYDAFYGNMDGKKMMNV